VNALTPFYYAPKTPLQGFTVYEVNTLAEALGTLDENIK